VGHREGTVVAIAEAGEYAHCRHAPRRSARIAVTAREAAPPAHRHRRRPAHWWPTPMARG